MGRPYLRLEEGLLRLLARVLGKGVLWQGIHSGYSIPGLAGIQGVLERPHGQVSRESAVVDAAAHRERKGYNQGDKRESEQREKADAVKRDFHVPKEEATPPLLGLANFGLAIGANIPNLIAIANR